MTILIEDTRMECDEPSLVEVRIPLQPAKDGSFWADAVDVCKHLQTGPSRIDGPAKVYCFRGHGPRGRFRQYFLRISAENIDNFVSANLYVTAKRILRVVVEEVGTIAFSKRVSIHIDKLFDPARLSSSSTCDFTTNIVSHALTCSLNPPRFPCPIGTISAVYFKRL
ncbi:hypothetical protein DFH11DRAFT_1501568 [Phellopilus nigrolimitatus]|nr:hypothetical protein DFH11DRAFT_1501568 [Phellopilus nigrolimitatus]